MTGTQSGIMWLGLLLIVVRLFTTNQGEQLWTMITTGGNAAPTTGPGSPPNKGPNTTKPVNGKCPTGYILSGGKCLNDTGIVGGTEAM